MKLKDVSEEKDAPRVEFLPFSAVLKEPITDEDVLRLGWYLPRNSSMLLELWEAPEDAGTHPPMPREPSRRVDGSTIDPSRRSAVNTDASVRDAASIPPTA